MSVAVRTSESPINAADSALARPPTRASGLLTPSAGCIGCGVQNDGIAFSRHHPWLKQCVGCGLQFADPQPTDQELGEIYGADYYAAFGYRRQQADCYHQMMQSRATRLLASAEVSFPVGRLLDVGSGLGDLLVVGRERGWEVRGVELNPYAVEQCEEYVPGATFCGRIEDFEMDAGSFDLITCLDVIEHLRRPDEVLERFHEWLRAGGGLIISTPDVGSLLARLMGSRWPHYHRDHLWYFNRRSLIAVVERAGFEILGCRRAKKAFTLQYLLSILSQPEQAPLIRRAAAGLLRIVPGWIARRMFPLREGLFVMARRR